MSNTNYETYRGAVIKMLNDLIQQHTDSGDPPRIIGGPHNLSPKEMLREVENNTDVGREIIEGYAKVMAQFPVNPDESSS